MSATLHLSPPRSAPISADQADTGTSPILRKLMLWALYAIPIVVAVRPVGVPLLEPDVWWHLRVGQWVSQHHTVPVHDPFSLPGQTKHWVAYSWLYEVLIFGLHSAFGLVGIILYRVLLAVAIVAAVHALAVRVKPHNFLVTIALTAAATLALAGLFSERPWLFTILFTTLTLHVIVVLRQPAAPPRWVWALPFVYVLWANIHIQFVYGLFLLGLACGAPLIDRRLGRVPDESAGSPWSRRWYQLIGLAAACFLATLLNPYHVRLYGVVIEYATQPGPFNSVNELRALAFREVGDWVVLALTGAACWMLGRRKSSAFEMLFLAAAAWFAFRARRDLWFVVLADLVILADFTWHRRPACGEEDPGEPREDHRRAACATGRIETIAVVGLGLLGLAGLCAWERDLSAAGLQRKVEKAFPIEAARVVAQRGDAGPLYNDFNWGGFFIWSLPHLPVSIDGRTNLHGDERIDRFGRTWAGAPGWEKDPDLSQAGVIIAPADSPLVSLLLGDPRFERVHKDDLACVFVARKK